MVRYVHKLVRGGEIVKDKKYKEMSVFEMAESCLLKIWWYDPKIKVAGLCTEEIIQEIILYSLLRNRRTIANLKKQGNPNWKKLKELYICDNFAKCAVYNLGRSNQRQFENEVAFGDEVYNYTGAEDKFEGDDWI